MPHSHITKASASKYIHMCVAAPSGWGKTPFAASADKVLILSVDPEGADSAAYAGYDCDVWRARTKQEVDDCFLYMRDGNGCNEYNWLAVDSIWETQNVFMRAALNAEHARKPAQDPDIPAQGLYFKTQLQILEFVKKVNELPINVLYTTVILETDDTEGEPIFMPFLHGQKGDVSKQFYGYTSIMGMGEVREDGTRRLWFRDHKMYRGRDRTQSLGNFKDNPTLSQIEAIVSKKRASLKSAGNRGGAAKTATPPAARKTAPATRRRVPSAG